MESRTPELWSEDLIGQARRGLALGRKHCACPGRYHWLYGSMRAAGAVSSLKSEEPQLAGILNPLLREGARIMIGGSADTGLFCAMGRLVGSRAAEITVVDRCSAPLALIGEFAEARGLRCRTIHADLLALDGGEQWDMILLHYTLNFVPPHLRGMFFRALASVLAPGGVLVCAAMTGMPITQSQQPGLAAAFAARSREALARTALAEEAAAAEFQHLLDIYSADTTAMRLIWPNAEDVRGEMHNAGFELHGKHAISRDWSLFGHTETGRRLDSSSILVAVRG